MSLSASWFDFPQFFIWLDSFSWVQSLLLYCLSDDNKMSIHFLGNVEQEEETRADKLI